MSTEKSVYGLVTPEENLITQLAGYVRGGRSIQMTTLVGVLQLLEQWSTEITSLNQQLSAKIISEQNIINAFGISGEGAHSKLVIEYVHGLVAENAALNGAIERVSGVYKLSPHIQKLCEIKTPNTDAFTAELRAQGVDEYANATIAIGEDERNLDIIYAGNQAKLFAANLRAGRKG
ncbi:hypothetical protein [Rahnella variigena]|uniref:hypothetical protein n=1 Tax=Rahnella variigena TaxID=574964 RepID=UPI0028DCF0F7|nr:hypothetical protein [Rahnella variigena]